jgi:Zn-dependent protease with chaperone function/uncharacterized RDD family membrane protein YckC
VTALFSGRQSLRVRGERMTFVLTLCSLPLTVVVLGWVFQHQITWQEITLLVVVAMVYVAFARGRLLGGGLRIHAGQFSQIHAVVDECARMLRMPTPHVFIRDDPFVPVVAIGIGDPYAVVISAQYVEHFRDDELRFLIGRELGHIASGHTRYTSLMSSNGRENGVLAIALGAWLRRIDYTADRVGLLCCGSLDAAMRAIAVAAFGSVGRKVDLRAFAEQLKELHAEPSLRLAEWTASTPYATNRIAALHRFARDPLYVTWAPRFAEGASAPEVAGNAEAAFAGFWRRAWAFAIDIVVIQTLAPAAGSVIKTGMLQGGTVLFSSAHTKITFANNDSLLFPLFLLYAIVLVALAGQTLGMMISDVRVVAANRDARVGFGRAIARYASFVVSLFALVGVFSLFRRVQPYEKWSRTRLISGSAPVRS